MGNTKEDFTSIDQLGEFIHDEDPNLDEQFATVVQESSPIEPLEEVEEFRPNLDHLNDFSTPPEVQPELQLDEPAEVVSEFIPEFPEIPEEAVEPEEPEEPEIFEKIELPVVKEIKEEIKNYVETLPIKEHATPNFSQGPFFSIILREIDSNELQKKVLQILDETVSLPFEQRRVMDQTISTKRLLIPQIPEYCAIILFHQLKKLPISIQVGYSHEIFLPEHETNISQSIHKSSIYTFLQNKKLEVNIEAYQLTINDIMVTSMNIFEGYQIKEYFGVHTQQKIFNSQEILQNNNDGQSLYTELITKLKEKAITLKANAIVGLQCFLSPIQNNQTKGLLHSLEQTTYYQANCLANVVWVQKTL